MEGGRHTEKNSTKVINETCLSCRLISGGACIAIGIYIYQQSKKQKSLMSRNSMKVLTAVPVGLGVARLLNMEFLKADKSKRI